MKFSFTSIVAVVAVALNAGQPVQAGPIAMGLCYSACNAGMCSSFKRLRPRNLQDVLGYITCVTAAGFTAGTFTLGLGMPLALFGCSAVQGACMAACTPLLAAPTP